MELRERKKCMLCLKKFTGIIKSACLTNTVVPINIGRESSLSQSKSALSDNLIDLLVSNPILDKIELTRAETRNDP
jgi:hypothetical protein